MNSFIINKHYCEDIYSVLTHHYPWDILSGKSILVTGATGMLGSFITDVLMLNPKRDYQVYICGRNEQKAKARFTAYWGNSEFHYFTQNLEEELKNEVPFYIIIHCAGLSYPAAFSTNPVGTSLGIVYGTNNLLKYSIKTGCKKFLYISSGEVYGEGASKWREHDSGYVDILKSRSCYPTAKRAAENLCIAYSEQYDLNVYIARPSHIYGATFTSDDNRAYCQFIRNAVDGKNIVLNSLGNQRRSYCYVADCVSALLHILFYGKSKQAYNIANNNDFISVRELAEIIAESVSVKVISPNDCNDAKLSLSNAQILLDTSLVEELGWEAFTNINQGVNNIIKILSNYE